jgi:aryl-alcohol dehydrogenase-like predicted oxidoreductase
METRPFRDLDLSACMLGTVQFGLPYGIANRTGQPPFAEVCEVLRVAREGGVNCLDTAPSYGTSEEVLGRALAELGIGRDMVVATKVVQIADEGVGPREADAIVERSVTESLKRLRLERLPICLFHKESNFFRHAESLRKMKDRGMVRFIGASVNTPGDALAIVRSGIADAIQIPSSVLDRRFTSAGIGELAGARGVAIFARSIYLQGLLLMPEEEILPELAEVIPVRRRLQSLAAEGGMDLDELAVRYLLSAPGFVSLVIGVETADQMRRNVGLFRRGPLEPAFLERVASAVPDLSERILFPRNWSKRMPDVGQVSR